MSEQPIPVAVVGAGNMGSNHVRVYDELSGADLVEVVEPDPDRAAEIRETYEVTVHDDVSDLCEAMAATVAVPNRYHHEIAIDLAKQGIDILVEKPLANSVEAAKATVNAVEENDVLLQVGHIERFNPAVQTLMDVIEPENVVAVEAHRLGPFDKHLANENVVLDLMIHDLDVVEALVGSRPELVNAVGRSIHSRTYDHVKTQFEFENGVLAAFTASQVTNGKVRQLAITTEDAYVELDYQKQDVQIRRVGNEKFTSFVNRSGYRAETITETPFISNREPLKNEVEHFLSCVRTRNRPLVSGAEGLRAVERTQKVLDQLGSY